MKKRIGRFGNNRTSESSSARRWGNKKWFLALAFVNRHSPKAIWVAACCESSLGCFFLPRSRNGKSRAKNGRAKLFARASWQFVFCATARPNCESIHIAEPTSGICDELRHPKFARMILRPFVTALTDRFIWPISKLIVPSWSYERKLIVIINLRPLVWADDDRVL